MKLLLLPGVHWIEVGTRKHRRFTEDDIRIIQKIDELQGKGLGDDDFECD